MFVLAVGYKLFPWLKLPAALWMMIGLIALVKTVNAISSFVVKHRIEFLHTKANKVTGFLLFIGMMTIGQSYFVPVAWAIASPSSPPYRKVISFVANSPSVTFPCRISQIFGYIGNYSYFCGRKLIKRK